MFITPGKPIDFRPLVGVASFTPFVTIGSGGPPCNGMVTWPHPAKVIEIQHCSCGGWCHGEVVYAQSFMSKLSEYTLPETNSLPLKMVVSNRNLLFQGTIFRCYVGLREGNLTGICLEFRSNMTIEPCSFVFIHVYPYSSMFNRKKHLWQKVDVFQPAMFTVYQQG